MILEYYDIYWTYKKGLNLKRKVSANTIVHAMMVNEKYKIHEELSLNWIYSITFFYLNIENSFCRFIIYI